MTLPRPLRFAIAFARELRHTSIVDSVMLVDLNHGCDLYLAATDGTPCIRPNRYGIFLLGLVEAFVLRPYAAGRQAICTHPNMVDDSYGGPESGAMGCHCPDCGLAYFTHLY